MGKPPKDPSDFDPEEKTPIEAPAHVAGPPRPPDTPERRIAIAETNERAARAELEVCRRQLEVITTERDNFEHRASKLAVALAGAKAQVQGLQAEIERLKKLSRRKL